ncbi:MAG: hypothetical protein GWN99_04285, partial [Gemmatimonadetes bacterium]|nr:hypothetical protein [Gemmatimonadota bacterium]NIS00283.1 hypothetical protein [Gemmatimonadota bacterium]NIT65937.1 hypothetical protein [Gemmatimonadota bacterium]NIV25457.1 hypothetical protein [Gemmatimonadota bacterium]NIW77107.1 hypothetical protein [Gemmatimonadota bacterium]
MLELAELFDDQPETELELFHLAPPGLDQEERRVRVEELYEGLKDLGVTPGEGGRSIRVEETDR